MRCLDPKNPHQLLIDCAISRVWRVLVLMVTLLGCTTTKFQPIAVSTPCDAPAVTGLRVW